VAHFWQRLRPLLWIVLGLLVLYSAQSLPAGQYANLIITPIVDGLYAPVRWLEASRLWLQDKSSLQSQFITQQVRLEQQASLIQETNTLREENKQLRRLLGLKAQAGSRWQAARVLARSPDKLSRHLTIEVDGADADQVVASSEGLVGLVDTADKRHAVVRTILDASLAVPVTIKDQPLAALIRGQGNSLQVEFVPWASAPPVGSRLQTSGAGGIYPPGIPVARITRIQQVAGSPFAQVKAEPLAHWRRDAWLAVAIRGKP